jgi:two-component sensor histidine kinase/CheY-like chemotaxis protein
MTGRKNTHTMNHSLAVLIIEDSEQDALLIAHHIEESGYRLTSARVETAEEMAKSLQKDAWDVVLSDYSLPEFDAAEALALLQQSDVDLPFIIVSGAIGEETAVALMRAGAHDYVLKTNLARLVPVIERAIAETHVRRERNAAEEMIRLSLKEKEVMLKEIHHRVKNNLQIICSLLYLQMGRLRDPEMQLLFLETQQRVRSMALVHDKLYASPSLASIDFNCYVQSMSADLLRAFAMHRVTLSTDITDVSLGVDTAVPCGLILNELLSNSLRHAFPDSNAGHIHVSVTCEVPGEYTLEVRDNGVGYPAGFDLRRSGSPGSQIICSLVNQLDGTYSTENKNGAVTTIRFRVPVPPSLINAGQKAMDGRCPDSR